ncbi:MAG TPA: DUF3160 domain-containing protein [Candidatus Parcubacteria bacterium]|nr:DUF3160 domain-containing protein [Candidatus Parcubacteria bacterium]
MENQNFNSPLSGENTTNNFQSPMGPKPKSKTGLIVGILGILVIVALIIFLPKLEKGAIQYEMTNIYYKPPVAVASKFATYEKIPVNVSPRISAYSIKNDLSNIVNADDFSLSEKAKEMLVKNGFVVLPFWDNEFFPLYENNRYTYTPSFITTDSILHNYHLMFDFLLENLEKKELASELRKLSLNMLSESLNQYNELKGTEWENAAKRNVGFFAVGAKLLDSTVDVPSIVANEVNQELALIKDHQDFEISPVMNIGTTSRTQNIGPLREDYSQYIPRGHYNKTQELKAYFKAMMWYGRLTFRMASNDELKSALLITLTLNNKEENQDSWNKIYEPINFFVGKTDDIDYHQFKDLLEKVYGKNVRIQSLVSNKSRFADFIKEAESLEPPRINSIPIFEASIQANKDKEILGFRFMGQRFTIDTAIFQKLIYREVGDKTKSCQEFKPEETNCLSGARCMPKGLDIPAAMGSEEALNILKKQGETQYACYNENMSKLRTYLSELPKENWTQNLYWGWLYQLLPLLKEKPEGYPSFMRNIAWLRKDLNTFLGSWTELKHDTILYTKQVYAELGAGGSEPTPKDDRGYVEPEPYVYARLVSLLKMTREGLEIRGLLTSRMADDLKKMEQLAMSLKTISEKELNNEKLTDQEYELIRSYGGQLEHFWLEVNRDMMGDTNEYSYLDDNPAAVVADVATNSGQVLEEGTGKVFEIYTVVPVDGKLRIAKGGVYSYYEFSWPMSDRLTDEKWRNLLDSGQAPAMPSWTNLFIAK